MHPAYSPQWLSSSTLPRRGLLNVNWPIQGRFPVVVMEVVGVTHESWVGLQYDIDYQLDEENI
jgi:hypothetical protein